jgi:hypothetical protein
MNTGAKNAGKNLKLGREYRMTQLRIALNVAVQPKN